MSTPVIILGTGGHACVLAEALRLRKVPVIGCVANKEPKRLPAHLSFLGDDHVVLTYDPDTVVLVNGIGSVGRPDTRRRIFNRFREKGYHFATVVHPSSVIAEDVELAEGAQVMAGVVIQSGCRLGENVIINTGSLVDYDCRIGAHSHVAPGTVLSGGVNIGEGAHVGTGARVIQSIEIGADTVVGAGAIVIRDIADGATVAGTPARPLPSGHRRAKELSSEAVAALSSAPAAQPGPARAGMKLGYFGDGPWASRVLEALVESKRFDIAFITPRYDRQDPELRAWAEQLGVPFIPHQNVNSPSFLEHIARFNCDLFVSMSFDQIMKSDIINLAPQGFINCHAGALPFYRGRNPLNWALINGEPSFGVTVHYIDVGIDSGDIIVRRLVDIAQDDTYADLLEKAYGACSGALLQALDEIADGTAPRVVQDKIHPVGFYCGRRVPGDEWIDWSLPSERIRNLVRALSLPGPGARTLGDVGVVAVLGARTIVGAPDYIGTVGEVVGRTKEGVVIKTGDSTLLLTEVAFVNGNDESGPSFVPTWRIGTRLGLSLIAEIHRLRSAVAEIESRVAAVERDAKVGSLTVEK